MPLLFRHTAPLWGVWKIEESSDTLFSLLKNGEEYLPELENIRMEHRRQEWIASRVLLQNLSGTPTRIAYHANGSPYLPDSPFYISISHTKGYAAVLVQEHPAAGIDIEYRSDRVKKIRSRFMTQEEEEGLDKEYETEHLLIHWCAKEVLFKMIGQEEVDFRHHLHVCPFPYAEEGCFTVKETRSGSSRQYLLGFRVFQEFVLTWSLGK